MDERCRVGIANINNTTKERTMSKETKTRKLDRINSYARMVVQHALTGLFDRAREAIKDTYEIAKRENLDLGEMVHPLNKELEFFDETVAESKREKDSDLVVEFADTFAFQVDDHVKCRLGLGVYQDRPIEGITIGS